MQPLSCYSDILGNILRWHAGFDNLDPAVQEEWKKMALKGDRPTPEEVINYAVKKLVPIYICVSDVSTV